MALRKNKRAPEIDALGGMTEQEREEYDRLEREVLELRATRQRLQARRHELYMLGFHRSRAIAWGFRNSKYLI